VKIDVGRSAIATDPAFIGKKVLVITGERAEESPGRAKYLQEELHRCDAQGPRKRRLVHAWRPVHKWSEKDVWRILETWNVRAHPAYEIGFSRASCMTCIFGNADQWATIRYIDPQRFERIAQYEEQFNTTINRKLSVRVQADKGRPYEAAVKSPELVALALSETYNSWELIVPAGTWKLPAGAYGESGGPT
jgi:3'-phosphoadenosine 5'-phosphosulfate sulfotransferase (PAPS reductase)/FAD synthetase